MSEKSDIRLIKGVRISSKQEVESFLDANKEKPGFLAGSASNFEVVKRDSYLYDTKTDLYGNIDLKIPADRFPNVNLVVGAMGSGKTNFLDNLIAKYIDNHKIIHDPKMEEVPKFFNPAKGDIMIGHPDARSVVWDIFGEIKKDKQKGRVIFENMLNAIRGDSKEGQEWVTYGVQRLMRLVTETLSYNPQPRDYAGTFLDCYNAYKKSIGDDRFETSALGTAEPVIELIFQMYFIADNDNRQLVTVEDIAKARNVFLCNRTDFVQQLTIINNALLAMIIGHDMARPEVKRGDIDNYSFYILDEFLTFKLDQGSEKALLTLCRAKGVSVWLGMQYLPQDKERLSMITASRYATVIFSPGDAYTVEEVSKLSGDILYQRQEYNLTMQDSGSMFSASSPSQAETWLNVETKQIPKEVLQELSPYVAYLELSVKDPGVQSVNIKTFIKPVLVVAPAKNPDWVASDVVREAPFLSECPEEVVNV